MKLKLLFLAIAAMMLSCQPQESSTDEDDDEDENSIEGAWEIVESTITTLDSSWTYAPYRSLILYTGNYYSVEIAQEERPSWPDRPDGEGPSDENIINAYNGLTSNSGKYEVRGDSIFYEAVIAKYPNFMNNAPKFTNKYTLEGNQLTINSNFRGGVGSSTTTYRRLE